VAAFARDPATVATAPPPPSGPRSYTTLVPGTEREHQWQLGWWDRFQSAAGLLPSLSRFVVAGTVVAGIVLLGTSLGASALVIYNGLGRDVVVRLGNRSYELQAFSRALVDDVDERRLHVYAKTTAGEAIEAFDASFEHSFRRYVYDVAGAAPLVRWTAVYGPATGSPARKLGAPRWSVTDANILFEQPPTSMSTQSGAGETRQVLTAFSAEPPPEVLAALEDAKAREQVVRTHATWDGPTLPHTGEWLHLARGLPDFATIVRTRLMRDSGDVPTMRAEQDQPDASAAAAACDRQTRMALGSANDDDLRYLSIRCQPRGAARDEATLAAHVRAPQNAWLAFAAGYVHAHRSEWKRALECWEIARGSNALAERTVIESARVMRVVGQEIDGDLQALARQSADLRTYLALESGSGATPTQGIPYAKLATGALQDAIEAASGDAPTYARIVRLVAASRGATPQQIAAALALPPNAGLDYHTIWPAIGLALREKQDAAGLIARMKDFVPREEGSLLEQFLRPDLLAADPKTALAAVSALDPIERGHAYVLGAVILGDAAPDHWRTEARALLFAPERPFL
jgi:hypothetical protein